MPLSLIIIFLCLAIIFHKRNSKLSFRYLIIGTVLLVITTLPPISDSLMESLENNYPAYTKSNDDIDYIVVLGCYHYSDDRLPATMQLKTCSLQRLVEAVRIANLHPNALIIMSGAAGHNPESNAEKMKEAAVILGVADERILTENFPKDTQEEAELISPRIKGSKVVLITNADHMLRSINYFKHEGINAIPAPASYWVKGNVNVKGFSWNYYTPHSKTLEQTTIYWYESLGLIAQWFNHLFSENKIEPKGQNIKENEITKKVHSEKESEKGT